jgi:hypothetical protein
MMEEYNLKLILIYVLTFFVFPLFLLFLKNWSRGIPGLHYH